MRLLDQLSVVAACGGAVVTAVLALALASPAAASDGSSSSGGTTAGESAPESGTGDDTDSPTTESTDGSPGTTSESEPAADTGDSAPDTSTGDPTAPAPSDGDGESTSSDGDAEAADSSGEEAGADSTGEGTDPEGAPTEDSCTSDCESTAAQGPPDPAAAPPDPTAPPGGSRPKQASAPAPVPGPIVSLPAPAPGSGTTVTVVVTEAQATTLSTAAVVQLGTQAAGLVELTIGSAPGPAARWSKPRRRETAGAAARAHPIAFLVVAYHAAGTPYPVELTGVALAVITGTRQSPASGPASPQPENAEDDGKSSPPKLESGSPPTWPGGLTGKRLGASSGGLGGTTLEERNRHFGVLVFPRDLPASDFPVPEASGEEVLRPLATVAPLQRPG